VYYIARTKDRNLHNIYTEAEKTFDKLQTYSHGRRKILNKPKYKGSSSTCYRVSMKTS
jgi:hypothetical protein